MIKNGLKCVLVFVVLASVAASCGPRREEAIVGPHCAFADPEVAMEMGICNVAAEYYVAHHGWPLSKNQLEDQLKRLVEEAKPKMPADEAKDISTFLDRFTLIDLRRKGENLKLRYRFKAEKKTIDQTAILTPGATADEIMQTAR